MKLDAISACDSDAPLCIGVWSITNLGICSAVFAKHSRMGLDSGFGNGTGHGFAKGLPKDQIIFLEIDCWNVDNPPKQSWDKIRVVRTRKSVPSFPEWSCSGGGNGRRRARVLNTRGSGARPVCEQPRRVVRSAGNNSGNFQARSIAGFFAPEFPGGCRKPESSFSRPEP